MSSLTSWKELLEHAMHFTAESFEDLVDFFPLTLDWDKKFDNRYRKLPGGNVIAWSKKYVYFSWLHEEGKESIEAIFRNPPQEAGKSITHKQEENYLEVFGEIEEEIHKIKKKFNSHPNIWNEVLKAFLEKKEPT